MDENGRFTTSGKGASASDALKERGKASKNVQALPSIVEAILDKPSENEHDQIKLVDSDGRLCGYYEFWQVEDMPEVCIRSEDVVTMNSRPTTIRRLALLRRSFDNPSITPEQDEEVSREVDAILSARLGRKVTPTATRQRHSTPSPTKPDASQEDCFVVRDKHGLYLGMHNVAYARDRWGAAVKRGPIIVVNKEVGFRDANEAADVRLPSPTGYSQRVDNSLQMATRYVASFARRKSEGFWKARENITFAVLHRSGEPVCAVPYACLQWAFDDAWFVASRDAVQLVSTWSDEEVSKRVRRAVSMAESTYYDIARPGGLSITKKQHEKAERRKAKQTRQEASRPTQRKATVAQKQNPVRKSSQATHEGYQPRRVTRDERGCFLGVFTIDEARMVWQDARPDNAVIVVPRTVEFAEAAASIGFTKSFDTEFGMAQYKQAVARASDLPKALVSMRAEAFWDSITNKRLTVRNNSPDAIASLNPTDLTEAFGNGWFLVSTDEAQVMLNKAAGVVSVRARFIEKQKYPPETVGKASASQTQRKPSPDLPSQSGSEARKAARQREATQRALERMMSVPESVSQSNLTKSTSKSKANTKQRSKDKKRFYVYKNDGRIAYQCKAERGAKVVAFLERLLPSYAHMTVPEGMKLTRSLRDLGFVNDAQFNQACAAAAKGRIPALEPRGTIATQNVRKATAAKRQPAHGSGGVVSFDGPENTLFVFKGTLSCERSGHKLEAVTGTIVTLKGRTVSINVNYCQDCGRYFLGQREYEHYRDMYGPILGNFSFYGSSSYYGNGFDGLSPKSILNLCGYNVGQNEGLSSDERQLILANIIDRGICSKPSVMSHIQWLINTREGNPTMWLACEKWEEDLDFVRNYNINRQRRFSISGVQRYR